MIELKRRTLRPVEAGTLCTMDHKVREQLQCTDDYKENGNVAQLQRNYENKLHIADGEFFYCTNDQAFNNKDYIEVTPVRFISDMHYNHKSFLLSVRRRLKVVMKRSAFHIVDRPQDIINTNLLEHNIKTVQKKFKLENKWKSLVS